jgi:hypothetical protein
VRQAIEAPRASRKGRVAATVVAAFALVFAAASGPAGAAGATRPLTTGLSGIYDPGTFQRVKETGARFVRVSIDWSDVAPSSLPTSWDPRNPADPNYDWHSGDRAIPEAVAAGLTPVVLIESAPSWAQRCQAPANVQLVPFCDPDPVALEAFAAAAARRYSGTFGGLPRVRYWQGMNEPNLSLFFYPQFSGGGAVSPALFRRLINAFYAGVKSVDRSNLVVAAGLGPIAVPKWTIGPMSFTRQLLCMRSNARPRKGSCGGGVRFDIFAIHSYTTGGPTHTGGVNDVQLGDLPKLRRLLAAADRAGRIKGAFRRTPLWVTEFSWDSNPPDPGGLPMKIESRWIAEALHGAWRDGVSAFFWFSLRDLPRRAGAPFSETAESGLYFRGPTVAQDQPKEVLYAFRFPFVAYAHRRGRPALDFWGRTPNSKGGRVAIQAWRGGKWRRIAIVRADRVGIFRGRIRSGYGRRGKGEVRAVYRGEAAIPFSMRRVRDFRHPPFGKPVG